ncbi:MAG: hypothetical protein WC340_10435 [Kiritimatiellia bacterium]
MTLELERPACGYTDGVKNTFETEKDKAIRNQIKIEDAVTALQDAVDLYDNIGVQGELDFGFGPTTPANIPAWLSEVFGTTTSGHERRGDYETTDGDVWSYIPAYWRRKGSVDSPRYADYSFEALDILPFSAYPDLATAAADGYSCPQAFRQGGLKKGFFWMKYKCGNDDGRIGSKVGLTPISLTAGATYTNSTLFGGSGIYADCVNLATAYNDGCHEITAQQAACISELQLAHAQAATDTDACAWLDLTGTTNFPKGANTGAGTAPADINDAACTFEMCDATTYSGDINKSKTGSCVYPKRCTHTGQSGGISDVNGNVYEVLIGMTQPGTSATDTTVLEAGSIYTLKDTVDVATLTGGWNGALDVWGDAAHIADLYDTVVTGVTAVASRWGGSAMSVSNDTDIDTDGYKAAAVLWPASQASLGGTNLFGNDYCYAYFRANCAPLCFGSWVYGSSAGCCARYWGDCRSYAGHNVGFRFAAYGRLPGS